MKKNLKAVFIVLSLLLIISCRRDELSVSGVLAQPCINAEGQMSLSLYLRTDVDSEANFNLSVTSPDGNLNWSVRPEKVVFDKLQYMGYSSIAMPGNIPLPKGYWTYELVYRDGRTVKEKFNVDYRDQEEFLLNNAELNELFFGEEYNLTYIPD